jgi:hypothetical protein
VRARVGCTSSRGVPSYPASPIVASPIVVSSVVASQATPCLYQPSQPPNEKKRPRGTCEQEWGVPPREACLRTQLARLWLARLLLARRRPAFHHDQPSQPPNEKKRPDVGCEGYVRARVGRTSSRGVPSYLASLARLWLARLWLARLWLARFGLARFGLARLLLARRRP